MLPVAVRLKVGLSEDTQLQWPDLVAGVRLDELALKGGGGKRSYEQSIKDLIKSKNQDKPK